MACADFSMTVPNRDGTYMVVSGGGVAELYNTVQSAAKDSTQWAFGT